MNYLNATLKVGLFLALVWGVQGHSATVAKSGPRTLILRVGPKEAALAIPGKLLKLVLANGGESIVMVKDKAKNLVVLEYIDNSLRLTKGEQIVLQSLATNEQARADQADAGHDGEAKKSPAESIETKSPATSLPFYSRLRRESDDPTVFILHHDRPMFLGELTSGNVNLSLEPKKAFAEGPTALPKVDLKFSQNLITLDGSWQNAAGIFFGGRVQLMETLAETKVPGVGVQSKNSAASQEISLYSAFAVNSHVGLGLQIVRNDLASKTEEQSIVTRESEHAQRLIPSILLSNRGSELALSWRPTMAAVGLAGQFKAIGLVSLQGNTYVRIVIDKSLIRGIGSEGKDPTSFGLGVGQTGRVYEMSILATAYEKVGALDNPDLHLEAFYGYGITSHVNYHIDGNQGVGAELFWQDRQSDSLETYKASFTTTGLLARYFYKF